MAAHTLKVSRILVVIGMVGVAAGTITQLVIEPWLHGPNRGLPSLTQIVAVPIGALLVGVAWWLFSEVVGVGPKPERAYRWSSVVLAVALLAISSDYFGQLYVLQQSQLMRERYHEPTYPHLHSWMAADASIAIGLVIIAIGFALASRVPSTPVSDSMSGSFALEGEPV